MSNMSDPHDNVRLQHMRDAAKKPIHHSKNRKRSDLDNDEMFALAMVRLVEIIGEAAKHVSEATRDMYPAITWRDIAGTRDRLIHAYFDVNNDILWQILSRDLPVLIEQLGESAD
jgi:uncharacterized protein with HEPN domain